MLWHLAESYDLPAAQTAPRQSRPCGHGFRAMARTILDEVLDYPIEVIEMQLAHAVKDANGRAYNRTKYREQRHKMMQHWSDYLDGLQANNVVAVKFGGVV